MDKQSATDFRYVLIIDDNDNDFLTLDSTDDETMVSGAQTDQWEIYYASSPQTAPVRAVGEHELGWYMMDFDDDHLAEVAAQSTGIQMEIG